MLRCLQVSCAVVRLLLEYGANPDLLCEGHSALSLAICSGNDLVRHVTRDLWQLIFTPSTAQVIQIEKKSFTG